MLNNVNKGEGGVMTMLMLARGYLLRFDEETIQIYFPAGNFAVLHNVV